jgi:hypothetical protein
MDTLLQNHNIQSAFLEHIRETLPKNLSFADELSEVLSLSRDSIYRRIRGETTLSLEEVKKLCDHYKISLDSFLSPSTAIISFQKRSIDPVQFTFENWLNSLLAQLESLKKEDTAEIFYCAKDIPPPYYFKFKNLARFKMFFWMKSYYRYPEYAEANYEPRLVAEKLLLTGEKLWNKYAEISSVELWSEETFNVTVRQVEFYRDNGFISLETSQVLLDEYKEMIQDIRHMAATGYKNQKNGVFKLYKNDFLISDTTILFKIGSKRLALITYNAMNILSTSQETFCLEAEAYLDNIINKSLLISTSGERDRNKFFNVTEERIQKAKNTLR